MTPRGSFGIVALAAAAGIAATCALGSWQLRRAAGKELLQRQIDAAATATPARPDASALQDPASLVHRHLQFDGRWLSDRAVYLDNRPQEGRAGFYVLMALHVDRPSPADLIVNRGWIPRDPTDRTRIAPFRTPDGIVAVTGVALDDEPRLMELAAPGNRPLGGIWQNFDFDAYAKSTGTSPIRMILREDGDVSADGLLRDWPDRGGALQSQIDRHHGYAFQWFGLAATIAVLFFYRVFRAIRPARPIRLEAEH